MLYLVLYDAKSAPFGLAIPLAHRELLPAAVYLCSFFITTFFILKFFIKELPVARKSPVIPPSLSHVHTPREFIETRRNFARKRLICRIFVDLGVKMRKLRFVDLAGF